MAHNSMWGAQHEAWTALVPGGPRNLRTVFTLLDCSKIERISLGATRFKDIAYKALPEVLERLRCRQTFDNDTGELLETTYQVGQPHTLHPTPAGLPQVFSPDNLPSLLRTFFFSSLHT